MTLVWDYNYLCKKRLFIAFFNFYLLLRLDDKLSNQPTGYAGFLRSNLSVVGPFVPKYIEKNLQ